MILQVPVTAYITTNAYFFIHDGDQHGFLIDPGAEADRLYRIIQEHKFTIERILLTHGHFDHIGAVAQLQSMLKVPVTMSGHGYEYVENPTWNLSESFGEPLTLSHVDYLVDGTIISLKETPSFQLKLIETPGHTTDGAIYYSKSDAVAFVGDTIFKSSYGRTDMYGGNEEMLFASITKKILRLPDETTLLSGHSDPTTVAEEKKMPWYAEDRKDVIPII